MSPAASGEAAGRTVRLRSTHTPVLGPGGDDDDVVSRRHDLS